MARVCPKCHESQPDAVEFCPTDGTRLSALAPVPRQPADGDRQHVATMLGVGGDQGQRLAAALQAQQSDSEDATQAFDLSALRRSPPAPPAAAAAAAAPPPPPTRAGPVPAPPTGTAQHKPVPAPARPASAAVPQPAAVPPLATTLAKIIESSGVLPASVAVARVCDVAELVMRGRPTTPITPAHIGYGDTTGSGKPRWTERGVLDPGYLAQYRPPDLDHGATPATDVYILACLLFEALTGKAPFRGKTIEEITRKQAIAAAPAVRQVKTDCDLPPALEIELQRALKKRPGDRHASAAAFAEAIRNSVREDDRSTTALDVSEAAFLQQLLQGGQALASAPAVAHGTASGRVAAALPVKAIVRATEPAVRAPAPAAAPPVAGQRTGLIAGLVVAAVVVVAGGVFLALRAGTPPAVPAPVKAAPPAVVPPPAQPDVMQTPDVAAPAPDVAPDVPPPEPDVPADIEKAKVKPLVKKPDVRPTEVRPDVKKPDPNRPPVF